jgi:mersacidin/lichenicidin family type 2 lantibiotic
MSHENIIRAWKDASFRESLGKTEQLLLPLHPAGLVELSDTDLRSAGGAVGGTGITVDSVMATCNGCVTDYNCY